MFGTHFFGKVNSVNGNYFVVTRFHHFFYFPLVYQGTFLITKDESKCLRIPFSLRSVIFSYLRNMLALVLLISIVTLMLGFLEWPSTRADWKFVMQGVMFFITSIVALWSTYQFDATDKVRQRELMSIVVKASPSDWLRIGQTKISFH